MEPAVILLICSYAAGFIVYGFGIKWGYFSIIPNTFLYKLLFCAAWPLVGIMFIWYHIKKAAQRTGRTREWHNEDAQRTGSRETKVI